MITSAIGNSETTSILITNQGLGSKVQLLDEYLSDVAGNVWDAATDIVLFVDAYDVLLLRDAGG
jgi:hypothetical protein